MVDGSQKVSGQQSRAQTKWRMTAVLIMSFLVVPKASCFQSFMLEEYNKKAVYVLGIYCN